MRNLLIGAGCALVLAGCGGGEREAARPAAAAAARPVATPDPVARHGRVLTVFRRVRYEGATMRVMTVYSDGFVTIDIPNGGAGGAKLETSLTPRALRRVRSTLAATPWRHLSKRKVVFDRSGAYFMLHHRGRDHVAMADGMSADLRPIVTRLNAVLTGPKRVVHRWGTP